MTDWIGFLRVSSLAVYLEGFGGEARFSSNIFEKKASYKYGRLVSGLCKATNRVLHVLCICFKLIYIDMFTFEVHTCAYIDIVIYI